MKKYLIYTALALTILSACKKTNTVAPGDLPEARVSAALALYNTTLTGSANGWKAVLFPKGGGVYLFSMKFSTTNRVSMLSDINATTSTTAVESSYKIKQEQAPSLLFDTYNYIHLLSDPDPTVMGGNAGTGLNSDFEFYFDTIKGDTVNLIGNRLGSKLMLIKAPTPAAYNSFVTGTAVVANQLSQLRTYFKRMTIGGIDCEVRVDLANKILTFNYLDSSGNLVTVVGNFYVDGATNTIVFITPVKIGNTTVTSMTNTSADAVNHLFIATINGTVVQMRESITPLKLDLTSPKRWHDQGLLNPNTTWISNTAFHLGVDDYCNFKNVPGYSSLWYALPPVFGNATYEGIIPFINNSLPGPYSISSSFNTSTPGIGRFILLGSGGTFTGTTPVALAMTQARALLYNGATGGSFQDWYFIQTNAGGTTFDMVRVSDAQCWISWKTR
ncbi:DUF4302 domain-containing protein [Mucilaginibacter sp. AW1-3]